MSFNNIRPQTPFDENVNPNIVKLTQTPFDENVNPNIIKRQRIVFNEQPFGYVPVNTLDRFMIAINKTVRVPTRQSNLPLVNDVNSLSSLVAQRGLQQSDKIKLGIYLEKVIETFIVDNSNLTSIKQKNIKNVHEKDHLFVDKINNVIVYAELKSNLNLDTEKIKSTIQKIKNIELELNELYGDNYTVYCFLINLRFLNISDMPKIITNKYNEIQEKVIGLNEYLDFFEIETIQSYEQYTQILNYLIDNYI